MPDSKANEPSEIRSREVALAALTNAWQRWHRTDTGTASQAEAMVVGALSPNVVETLRGKHHIQVESAAVTVARREVHHLRRDAKLARGAALADADLDRLPGNLAAPEAVLLDTHTGDSLIHVFTPMRADDPRKGKIAVRVNFREKLKFEGSPRQALTTNSVRSAGYVRTEDLLVSRYQPLMGTLR